MEETDNKPEDKSAEEGASSPEATTQDSVEETPSETGGPLHTVLNSAPREVLTAFNMDEDLVNKLLRFRNGLDNVRGTEDDQSFASLGGVVQQLNAFVEPLTPKEAAQLTSLISQNRLKVSSNVFRIHSSGRVRNGKVVRTVEGVVLGGPKKSSPLTLLSWHEN